MQCRWLIWGLVEYCRAHVSGILFFDILGFTSSSLVFPMVLLNFFKLNIFLFMLIWVLYFYTCMLNWAECAGHFPYRGDTHSLSTQKECPPHHHRSAAWRQGLTRKYSWQHRWPQCWPKGHPWSWSSAGLRKGITFPQLADSDGSFQFAGLSCVNMKMLLIAKC